MPAGSAGPAATSGASPTVPGMSRRERQGGRGRGAGDTGRLTQRAGGLPRRGPGAHPGRRAQKGDGRLEAPARGRALDEREARQTGGRRRAGACRRGGRGSDEGRRGDEGEAGRRRRGGGGATGAGCGGREAAERRVASRPRRGGPWDSRVGRWASRRLRVRAKAAPKRRGTSVAPRARSASRAAVTSGAKAADYTASERPRRSEDFGLPGLGEAAQVGHDDFREAGQVERVVPGRVRHGGEARKIAGSARCCERGASLIRRPDEARPRPSPRSALDAHRDRRLHRLRAARAGTSSARTGSPASS